jgi:hypothetical protein
MAVFDLIVKAPDHICKQSMELDNFYYSVDTASTSDVISWLDYNPYITTYILLDEQYRGYFNLMPIKESAALLFQRQELREEDLNHTHIVSPVDMHRARYFYMPGIAVKEFRSYRSRQAVAALMSGMMSYLLHMFDIGKIEAIYANPTTFQGNAIVQKLGFKPLHTIKKPLASGNDIYFIKPDADFVNLVKAMKKRFGRFVGKNPWPELGAVTLHPASAIRPLYIDLALKALRAEDPNWPLFEPKSPQAWQVAQYRNEVIGLVYRGDDKLWYGLHPIWRNRGLGKKLKQLLGV